MSRKKRSFLLFVLGLSLLVGAAQVASVPSRSVQLTVYEILNAETNDVFEITIPSGFKDDFRELLSADKELLVFNSIGHQNYVIPEGNFKYIHLRTREVRRWKPYVYHFMQGFLFVWLIYGVIQYLLKTLIVRRFREKLSGSRKKKRRR